MAIARAITPLVVLLAPLTIGLGRCQATDGESKAAPAWVESMTATHRKFDGQPGTLALFGDSITVSLAFWAPLADNPPGLSPQAAADLALVKRHLRPDAWRGGRGPESGSEGGTTVRWAAEHIDAWLAKADPEAAVILFGTNDLAQLDADEFESKLRDVTRRCLENGTVPILTTPPPRHGYEAKSAEFAERVRRLSRDLRVPLIDFHTEVFRRRPDDWDGTSEAFRAGAGNDEYDVPTLIARDGIHPSNPQAFRDYSDESLSKNGFALRNALTLTAYADVIRRVLRP